MAAGYVKLWRSIEDWEWYHDLPVRVLFQHLLLKVNWEEKRWQGRTIAPGQLVTSLESLSAGSGLSVKQVRTALEKLKSTGELGDETASKFRVVTLRKWAEYQSDDDVAASRGQAEGRQAASRGQAEGRQRATTKEEKKLRREEGKKLQLPLSGITEEAPSGFGDPAINELMAFLKAENGNLMDGSVKSNRYACATLIKKARTAKPDADPVAGIKHLIREGKKVHFHGPKITSFTYLLDHTTEIANLIRSGNGNGKQQSSEDKREAVRRAVLDQQGG